MSTRRKVLIMDKVSEKTKQLSRYYLIPEVDIFFCETDEDREKHISTADVLVTFTRGISKEWISKAKKCILIQKYGAGVNNIDIPEATKRGIFVANTSGKNARSVAEHAVLLMLAVFKHLTTAHNKIVMEGKWLKTELRDYSYELSYKKIGLIGMGNIGRHVARLLKGFECDIAYYDAIRLSTEDEKELGVHYNELDNLIKTSDVISLHLPLTEQTHHLINKQRLEAMKPTAILINTSRGGIVDEQALCEVLASGHLLGAGIDVFETEPIDQNHPLTKFENVIMTPHIGGGTNEAIKSVVEEACQNINSLLTTGRIVNDKLLVNREDLKRKGMC